MEQLAILPDVEALAVAVLNAEFQTRMPGVKWGTKVPTQRPVKFGRVMLSGGAEETMVTDQVQIIVEGWANLETDAFAITSLARSILCAVEGTLFGGFGIALPANLPDPTTSQTRYTALVGVRVRGTITA